MLLQHNFVAFRTMHMKEMCANRCTVKIYSCYKLAAVQG
jgi:hypothetical protein